MNDESLIATERPLPSAQRDLLRLLVGMMIPASADYRVPGADDEAIFRDILSVVKTQLAALETALDAVQSIAVQASAERLPSGRHFADLEGFERERVVAEFRGQHPLLAGLLVSLVTQCYYRDDRVMRSLDMEVRAPFPLGFELPESDWSLLDPVRARPRLYRDAD